MYTGGDALDIASSAYSTLPQPARIVLHLLEPYPGMGHTLFTDLYYTSIPLATTLCECNTAFIGTTIKNCVDLPAAIRSPTFRLGNDETMAFRCEKLLALGWRAAQKKKGLLMLSTESSAKSVMVQSQATGRTSLKPKVVDKYNLSMNGVDKADQYAVYSFVRKSRKWWRKFFLWLFEVTLVNSYILYRQTVPHPSTHLQFRHSIVDALTTQYMSMSAPRG